MRLRHLQALRAVMETGSATEAAERLHRTQPQVSRLIAALEEELGFKLFLRDRRRFTRTREGQLFYEQTKRILSGLDDVNRIADEIRSNRHARLRLIAQPYLAQALLPAAFDHFSELHPEARFSLEIRSRGDVGEWVGGHQFDIGVAALPIDAPNVRTEAFASVPIQAVLPSDHPLAAKQTIDLADLARQPFIALRPYTLLRHMIDDLLHEEGQSLDVRIETSSGLSACQMVQHGLGVTLADPLVARLVPDVVVRPWRPGLSLTYGFVHSLVHPPGEAAGSLAQIIAATARTLAPDCVSLRGQFT